MSILNRTGQHLLPRNPRENARYKCTLPGRPDLGNREEVARSSHSAENRGKLSKVASIPSHYVTEMNIYLPYFRLKIVGPAETPAKLREYVSNDNLPRMYGGDGPDIYHHKENAEAVQVPRGGKFLKVIDVPAGKGLSVDSYVNEGPLDISITSTSASVRSPKLLSPSINVVPSEERDEGPARNLQVFPATSEDRQVTVTWMNPARFSSKPLIYVLTVLDPLPK